MRDVQHKLFNAFVSALLSLSTLLSLGRQVTQVNSYGVSISTKYLRLRVKKR